MYIKNKLNFIFEKNGLILFFYFTKLCQVYGFDKICTVNSSDSESFLRCKAIIIYEAKEGKSISEHSIPSCDNYYESSLVVTSTRLQISEKITCASNRPIFLQPHFPQGNPKEEYMNVHWGRSFSSFKDKETYTYELHITPPFNNPFEARPPFMKYEIFTYFKNMKIEILWIQNKDFKRGFISSTPKGFANNEVHLIAADEIVNIPCLLNISSVKTFAKRSSPRDRVFQTVDNSSVWYNELSGFYLNTSVYHNWEGDYGCCLDSCMRSWNRIDVTINRQPNFTWTTDFHHLYQNSTTLKTPFFFVASEIERTTEIRIPGLDSLFVLTCTSKMGEVTFGFKSCSVSGYDYCVTEGGGDNYPTQGEYTDIVRTNKSKPEFTHTSKLVASCGRMKYEKFFQIYCQDSVTKSVLHTWKLNCDKSDLNVPKVDLTVEKEGSVFKCYRKEIRNRINDAKFDEINFRQIQCNNRFSCKEMSASVFVNLLKATTVHQGANCYPESDVPCKSLQVLSKGYFQCTLNRDFDKLQFERNSNYQDIYFQGFDKSIYIGNVEPPDSAVIKMELLSKTENEQIWLPANITLSCEAHSFYFERGIQWILVYENGIEQFAPIKNVSDIPMNAKNWDNVIRKSTIYLDDITLTEIICTAPTLSILDISTNYSEWKNVSIKFKLEYAVPPKIITESSAIKYVRIGEKDHILICEAFGHPAPDINWSYNGQEIQGDFKKVIDQLQFPVYNNSLAGDYVCTARNKGGSTNATFTVDTYVEASAMTIGNTLAVVLALFFLVAIPIAIVAFRRLLLQVKDLLTDDEVKEFREGIASLANEDRPLSLPYDVNYDLEESEFKIEKTKVLGQGAFGIVYSGTITKETYSGNVDFKTIRQKCNREQLKSLLSELKIMMY